MILYAFVLTFPNIYDILKYMGENNGNIRKISQNSNSPNRNKLYEIRTNEGLKITELARLSGVSDKTIRDLEKDKITSTQVTRRKIVNGLNRNPDKSKTWKYEEIF